MGFVILLLLLGLIALVGAAAGLHMMPLHRRTFSAMTREEHARYWHGLAIVLVSLVPLLLFVFLACLAVS